MTEAEDKIKEFLVELIDLFEKFHEEIPFYEMVHQTIATTTKIAVRATDNHLGAFEIIIGSIENGLHGTHLTKNEGEDDSTT